uniref:TPX2 C-terminal domain-containing protein n=1 Tax=Salix viminalis TaxID=40686 RepID=A0A6N2LVZ7_SALVM
MPRQIPSGCNEPNQRPYSRIDERGLGENDVPKLLASREDDNGTNEGHGEEDERNSSMDKGIDSPMESNDKAIGSDNKENASAMESNDDSKHILLSDDKENDREAIGSDDKENASASDDNREMDINTGHLKREILGKHESLKSTQKIDKAKRKPSKESFVTHATGAQELKHRKPKPTNPKPFRLRTDERRILKEATSEKKLHPAPLKEILPVKRFPGGNLQKKRQNALPRNDKSLNKPNQPMTLRKHLKWKETQHRKNNMLKNKERVRRKLSSAPQRHTVSSQQKLVAPLKKYSEEKTTAQNPRNVLKKTKVAPLKKYSEDKTTAQNLRKVLKKTKSPFVRKVARPQETSSITNETLSITNETLSIMIPGKLGVIKEDSPTILRPKEAEKPSKSSASPEIKASAVSRQSLQGKRSTTIPKEPNFHTIHTPKSCTRGVA